MKKILFYILTFFLMFGIVGCGKGNDNKHEHEFINGVCSCGEKEPQTDIDFNEQVASVVIPEKISSSIELPTTDETGKVKITWKTDSPEILDETGKFYMPLKTVAVTLTATFTYGNKTTEKKFPVICEVDTSNKFTLAYKMLTGSVKDEYIIDTTFPSTNFRTYTIKVESLNPEIISNEGVLNKQDVDQNAVLKITLTNSENNESQVYYKRVVIKKWTNQVFVDKIAEWAQEKVNQYVRGEIDKLPTEHEKYPSELIWTGGNHTFISKTGDYIVKPVEYVNDTITVKIKYANATTTKELFIENYGGNTEEKFLEEFLTYLMPTKIKAHHNYVYHQYGLDNDYFLKEQVEINTGGVLNLIDGQEITINKQYFNDVKNEPYKNKVWYNMEHRGVGSGVSQAKLDEYFGEGYVIPNDENIFWIVVHESGMPKPGDDALVLAEQQYRNVYEAETARQASWHYQVDDGVIYQSFDDSLELWHAGGTYTWLNYGNTNSIGIEMCINADGNYDGSMRHDAKLVAYLMDKYNLGIQNVKRHYDFAGKECPSYMIRTDRYNEFIEYVNQEYYAIKYLKDCNVNWTVSNLETLFEKGPNGLYYAKAVSVPTDVTITLDVTKGSFKFNKSVTITLEPDTIDLNIWALD